MEQSTLWVRLKPRNERKGIKLRRYLAFGMRFDESAGWYKVPTKIELSDKRIVDVGKYLSNVRNDNDDPESPLAFDVMTEKDARNLDAEERKAKEVRATAVEARPVKPVDMTTADLNSPPQEEHEVAEDEGTPGLAKQAVLAQPVRRRGRPPKAKSAPI
jgi:hypothetical protein